MNCREIISEIEKVFPVTSAEEWDNPGLLVGRRDKEVKRILVSLDALDSVINQAIERKADLLITHHPLIFGSLKKVNSDTFIGERILRLIENGISYYAMHTNYDVCGMADLNAEMLELEDASILSYSGEEEGLGRVGRLKIPMKYYDFAEHVKEVFELEDVRCYGEGNPSIRTIAVCGGSGKSLLSDVYASGADVFITGDIDYHTGIDAWANGLRIIDAGHYGTEHCFIPDCVRRFQNMFPDVEVLKADQSGPYKSL